MFFQIIKITLMTLLLLSHSNGCFAAADNRIFSLLVVDSQAGNPYDEVRGVMIKTLHGDGYRQGENLKIDFTVTGNDSKQGEEIIRTALAKQHYDVIYVGGTVATISAKNVLVGNMTQPVIFSSATDPVGIGVIKSFSSRPFANFSGVSYPVPPRTRFKFIKHFLPNAKTLGLIYADMPQSHSYNQWVTDLIANDPEFQGLKVIFRPVPLVTGENGDKIMAESAIPIIKELAPQVDAFIKPNDQLGTRRQFAEVVFNTANKPLIGITKDDVMGSWGATAVIYPSHQSIGEQTARMIKALFEGKKINGIMPEWPKQYGFAIDLQKTKKFNITVPVELLQLAGENIIK
ncbi:MAG: hypothetical protein HQL49_13490 [Gammaproteobacteria bacterium]|nr:hypothetical protein [Gammaproteobacteria bacterium]